MAATVDEFYGSCALVGGRDEYPMQSLRKLVRKLMAVMVGSFGAAIIAATIQGGVFWAYILIMLGVA